MPIFYYYAGIYGIAISNLINLSVLNYTNFIKVNSMVKKKAIW
jgi:hypothetical protein